MDVNSIAEKLLFNTCRIETNIGEETYGVATGFVFNHQINDQSYVFLVTNKHVVEDAKTGKITFLIKQDGKPQLGNPHSIVIDDFEKMWHGHPDDEVDIVVAPFVPILRKVLQKGIELFFINISNNLVPNQETINSLDAIEEVVFVGYPSGIWDSTNFLPIVRKGITATPICVDFDGDKKFLIDASVFEGSSGSPVFIYNNGMYAIKGKGTTVGTRIIFLGVIAKVYTETEENEIRVRNIPTSSEQFAISRQMLDLGIVFKASTVIETIENYLKLREII